MEVDDIGGPGTAGEDTASETKKKGEEG